MEQAFARKKISSIKAGRVWDAVWSNGLALILVIIWLFPVVWIGLTAFSTQTGFVSSTFFPATYTFDNFVYLFTKTNFKNWLLNTVLVALANTVCTTFFTIISAYTLSRFRFSGRKLIMNLTLILGMFPGFMAMVAIFMIFKALGLINNVWSLLIYYVAGAGMNFFVSKGYFDTIPGDIDEAAKLDGANQFRIFFQIYLPLAKPIIIYTALMAFMAPWTDYILASMVLTKSANWTVAVGFYSWMSGTNITQPHVFTSFAAAAIIVSVPIVGLYISLQRFFVEGISAGAVKG